MERKIPRNNDMRDNRGSEERRGSESSVRVHLRLPAPDAELLKRLATERDQTLSALVRHVVRWYVNVQPNR